MTRFSATREHDLVTTSFRFSHNVRNLLRLISRARRQPMRNVVSELIEREAKRLGVGQSE